MESKTLSDWRYETRQYLERMLKEGAKPDFDKTIVYTDEQLMGILSNYNSLLNAYIYDNNYYRSEYWKIIHELTLNNQSNGK